MEVTNFILWENITLVSKAIKRFFCIPKFCDFFIFYRQKEYLHKTAYFFGIKKKNNKCASKYVMLRLKQGIFKFCLFQGLQSNKLTYYQF